jgi:hypothetical protein
MKTGYTRDFETIHEYPEELGPGPMWKVTYIDAEELTKRLPGGRIFLETAAEGLHAELWDVLEELGPIMDQALRTAFYRALLENGFRPRIISSEKL